MGKLLSQIEDKTFSKLTDILGKNSVPWSGNNYQLNCYGGQDERQIRPYPGYGYKVSWVLNLAVNKSKSSWELVMFVR